MTFSSIHRAKSKVLQLFDSFLESETLLRSLSADEHSDRQVTIRHSITLQYARRILFYEPVLWLKALNKVSFKDLIFDDDFSIEDAERFSTLLGKRMEFELIWWKDATLEALDMAAKSVGGKPGNAANTGDFREFDIIYRAFSRLTVLERGSNPRGRRLDLQSCP